MRVVDPSSGYSGGRGFFIGRLVSQAPRIAFSAEELFSNTAPGAVAFVYEDALDFPAEGQFWNGLTVKYREVASLITANAFTAKPTASAVLVNGENVVFDAYNINDYRLLLIRTREDGLLR